jgi:hypothetical protein
VPLRIPALFLCLLALAAPSLAAGPKAGKWKATKVELGYSLSFKFADGKISKVVARVAHDCDGDGFSEDVQIVPDSSWKVKNGKFSGRHKEKHGALTAYYTLTGKFTSKSKAKGRIRYETIVAGSVCDTYERDFVAKRG